MGLDAQYNRETNKDSFQLAGKHFQKEKSKQITGKNIKQRFMMGEPGTFVLGQNSSH